MKKKYYKRTFLNKKEGTACVECTAYPDLTGTVKITDCLHAVRLEFNHYDKNNNALNLYKINKLIEELKAFKDVITGGKV